MERSNGITQFVFAVLNSREPSVGIAVFGVLLNLLDEVLLALFVVAILDGFDTALVVVGSGMLRFFGAYKGSAYCK